MFTDKSAQTSKFMIKLFFLTVLLCIGMAACQVGSTFDGNLISDDGIFKMDYSALNGQKVSSMILSEGESVRVSIAQKEGVVDVTIGIDGKEPIYEGNGLSHIDFTLNISQSGTYQISVTGHKACGTVSFIKVNDGEALNQTWHRIKVIDIPTMRRMKNGFDLEEDV